LRSLRILLIALWLALAPAAQAQDARTASWLRTVRETPLWSGPADPSIQFTTLPLGSFVVPRAGSELGRLLVYYPGDGATRQAGLAWVAGPDVAPSGPPPWIASSELDGDDAVPLAAPGPRRQVPLAPPPVSAPEIAVVDDDTGLMLYGRAPHAHAAPASTTKIATAIVTLEHAQSLDATVRVAVDGWAMAAADGSSVMGLQPGQRVTIRTLLYGLLLPSGNDAAEQLARSVAESRDQFITWMNSAAMDDLRLEDTHFVNPSGLDADGHYSSAYDLAQLARRAMRDDTFREIVATPHFKSDGFVLAGHNPLLGTYPGADGVKTGSTDAAGKAIVGSAVKSGHRVYVVVLHSDDLLADSTALFDWVWQAFTW
jgi:D-alanyl-D-alanine carboxypeptidase